MFTAPKNMKGHNIHIYTEQDNDIENIYNIKAINNQEKFIQH